MDLNPGNFGTVTLYFANTPIEIQTPERYQAIRIINVGSQGIVFEAWDLQNNKRVAIKKMRELFAAPGSIKQCYREFILGAAVHHDYIIRVNDAYTPQPNLLQFRDLYLVYEYMDSNLAQLNSERRDLFDGSHGADFVAILMRQLLCAVRHLHQKKLRLIHRDIKPSNILVRKDPKHPFDYHLKLADLGSARKLPPEDEETMSKYIVTRPYRAPEIILTDNYERPVDLWSVGCVLVELVMNQVLFAEKDQLLLIYKIMQFIGVTDEQINNLPEFVKENVVQSRERFSTNHLETALKSAAPNWGSSAITIDDLIFLAKQLLIFNPSERITAEDALNLPLWTPMGNNYCLEVEANAFFVEESENRSIDQWKHQKMRHPHFNKTFFGFSHDLFFSIPEYDPLKKIGEGSQGLVCRAWDNDHNMHVAIKECKPFSNAENAKRIYREFVLSRIVKHRNIIHLLYAYTPEDSYEAMTNMYLVYEYMDATLLAFIRRNRKFFGGTDGGEFIGFLSHQLLSAVKYLHQHHLQLIHRDLNTQNILIKKNSNGTYDFTLKIADLGLARQLPFCDKINVTQSIGTLPYRAPEICTSSIYGTSVDMWSVGCVIFEMITGTRLFNAQNENDLLMKIVQIVPVEFQDLNEKLMIKAELAGIDFSEDKLTSKLKNRGQNWETDSPMNILNFEDLLHGMLKFNPENRLTAKEILEMPIWDFLNSENFQFYNYAQNHGTVGKPFVEEYSNFGTVDEWKKRLFETLLEYQKNRC